MYIPSKDFCKETGSKKNSLYNHLTAIKRQKPYLLKQLSWCCQAAILLVCTVQTEKLLLTVPCNSQLIHWAERKKKKDNTIIITSYV